MADRPVHQLTTRHSPDGKVVTAEGHISTLCGHDVKIAPGHLAAFATAFHHRVTCPDCLALACPAPGLHPGECCPPRPLPSRPALTAAEHLAQTKAYLTSVFAALREDSARAAP